MPQCVDSTFINAYWRIWGNTCGVRATNHVLNNNIVLMDIRALVVKEATDLFAKRIQKPSKAVSVHVEGECMEASRKWVYCTKNKLKRDKPVLDKYMRSCIYIDHIQKGFGRFNRQCSGCYHNALVRLEKHYNKPTPKLVKDKMVMQDVSNYHEGAGWYKFPNGDKVRGKENAEKYLKDKS